MEVATQGEFPKVSWRCRWGTDGLPQFVLASPSVVGTDTWGHAVVPEHIGFQGGPAIHHGAHRRQLNKGQTRAWITISFKLNLHFCQLLLFLSLGVKFLVFFFWRKQLSLFYKIKRNYKTRQDKLNFINQPSPLGSQDSLKFPPRDPNPIFLCERNRGNEMQSSWNTFVMQYKVTEAESCQTITNRVFVMYSSEGVVFSSYWSEWGNGWPNLLENVFPNLTVIKSMAPAHLDRSYYDILFEDIRTQLPVKLFTFTQWHPNHRQHKGQDCT